jgi:hypothetical protein
MAALAVGELSVVVAVVAQVQQERQHHLMQ